MNYDMALVFKALGDDTRLKIVEMLSCGELCGCDILEYFNITQPTLSYHMKILTESRIVVSKKEGSWIKYSNNNQLLEDIKIFWNQIMIKDKDCICNDLNEKKSCSTN